MIALKAIDSTNIEEVVALDVADDQQAFILDTTNLKCFADAHMLNMDGISASPFAIYAEDVMIGFVMYIYDTTDHESFEGLDIYGKKTYFVWHFMIAEPFQHKG